MKSFDWNIGEVPEGWSREHGAPRVINGDFSRGAMAAVMPPITFCPNGALPGTLCTYQFHYSQRHKVKAWLDWFMKEFDE